MKKILIIGAGACGLALARVLSTKHSAEVVIIDSVGDLEKKTHKKSPFEQEPIPFLAQPRFEGYEPTIEEIQSHPFSKFMGKPKWRK